MTSTQWAEFAGLGFAIAVLAWVIFRLTSSLVSIFKALFPDETMKEVTPDERAAGGGDDDN